MKIIFNPIVILLITLFVLITLILDHNFLGLSVLSVILFSNNAFQALGLFFRGRIAKASLLAYGAMWKKLSVEQRKELEIELTKGLLTKSKNEPKSINDIMYPKS